MPNMVDQGTAAMMALAEVIPFLTDINNNPDLGVSQWHKRHAVIIKAACERHGTEHCLPSHPLYGEPAPPSCPG